MKRQQLIYICKGRISTYYDSIKDNADSRQIGCIYNEKFSSKTEYAGDEIQIIKTLWLYWEICVQPITLKKE